MTLPSREALAPRATTRFTVVAQDPEVLVGTKILTAEIEVPAESLGDGPNGYRVHVVDYDASTKTTYPPVPESGLRHTNPTNDTIRNDPSFHAQNVYALVMRTLWRFEFALGRRVEWGFSGHQLKVAPHAFAEANAFFSPGDEALLFGYFGARTERGRTKTVFSCLSHDVVVHEASHALLNGLRGRFMRPSSRDQAALHEGFADVVALLSVLSMPEIVAQVLDHHAGELHEDWERLPTLVPKRWLTKGNLRSSLLFGLALEMGQEMSAVRGRPLRRSVEELLPSPRYYQEDPEFLEEHRRGEILVAAMMNAFLEAWHSRLHRMAGDAQNLAREWVSEEAATIADHMMTMAIRGIDYTPPVHVEFPDYLSAVVTADYEIRPDDRRYELRRHLVESFRAYGIEPGSQPHSDDGRWRRSDPGITNRTRTRFESFQRDRDEVFRFCWDNRVALNLPDEAYTRVLSVRPAGRANPDDGFFVRETVVELLQDLILDARDLRRFGMAKPDGMPNDLPVHLVGGVTLVFDEFGELKYTITKSLPRTRRDERSRHDQRLEYLYRNGYLGAGGYRRQDFAALHQLRATGASSVMQERFMQERW